MPDTDSYEMSEEQFASIFAAMGFFKDLNSEQPIYDDLIHLSTSKTTNKIHLTVRNAKAIVLAINNIYCEWMRE